MSQEVDRDIKKLYISALKKKIKLSHHPYPNMPKQYIRIKYSRVEVASGMHDLCVLFMR